MWAQAQIFCLSVLVAMATSSPLQSSNDLLLTRIVRDANHNGSILESVCQTMNPSHGKSQGQETPAPYTVTVSKKNVSPGDTVQVIVTGNDNTEFRGIYIQGRNGDGVPVGQFLPSEPDTPNITLTDCPLGQQNTASYISSQPITRLVLNYVVPEKQPVIVFRSTFVQTFAVFWIGVVSEALSVA